MGKEGFGEVNIIVLENANQTGIMFVSNYFQILDCVPSNELQCQE